MSFLKQLIGSGKKADASALRAALEAAEERGNAAAAELERLAGERARVLLDGPEAELDRVEAELAKAQREADRCDLAAAELRQRLDATAAAEEKARLDGIASKAEANQNRGVKLILEDYAAAAEKLAGILAELDGINTSIAEANSALEAAGDGRRIEPPDMVARPRQGFPMVIPDITALAWLPSIEAPDRFVRPGYYVWGQRLPQSEKRPAR